MKMVKLILLVLASVFVASPLYSQMKISGKAYADYFYNIKNNDADLEGKNGFWFRRVRLTADNKISDVLKTRFRLEVSSKGDFASEDTYTPYLKDAYLDLKTSIIGKDVFRLGLMETIGKKTVEKLWGYRGFEKTPTDFYKYRSSRDIGLLFTGKRSIFDYSVMVGNESSNKMKVSKKKKIYASLGVKAIDGLYVQGYYDNNIDDDFNSSLAQIFVAYDYDGIGRVGFLYASVNQDKAGEDGETIDLSNNIMSVYVITHLHKDVDLILRYDEISEELIKPTGMAYTPLRSAEGKTRAIFAGFSYNGIENLYIMPYVAYFSYEEAGLDADIYARLTFEFRY